MTLLHRAGFEVVGEAGNVDSMVGLTRETAPAIVIVDIEMLRSRAVDMLEAASLIRQEFPGTKILVLSAQMDAEQVVALLDQQGVGYLLKAGVTDVDEFIAAVGQILKGGSVVDPAVARSLFERRNGPLSRLSDREREVLSLVAEGRSNLGIARQLFVRVDTVEKHLNSAYTKLDITADTNDHRRVLAVLKVLNTH